MKFVHNLRVRAEAQRPKRFPVLPEAVGDTLSDALRADLGCSADAAEDLARRAREHLARVLGSAEDSDEDLVLRLQDPRTFGAFAESLVADPGLPMGIRTSVVERVFDLLPLPRTEGEVILVGDRSPPGLLSLAGFLAERDGLTVLHAMHPLYAVFLDRSLLTQAPRSTRAFLAERMARLDGSTERLRVLYLAFDLAAVPERESRDTLRGVLRSRHLPESLKRSVASLVAAEDGGLEGLMRMAQEEGLLPSGFGEPDAPGVLANIPRMPATLAPIGRRWLRHEPSSGEKPETR